jgi:hypothetical protein
MNLISDAVKIEGTITREGILDVQELLNHTVDAFVSQVFRFAATTAHKYLDQPPPNFFVLLTGLRAVGVEPSEQGVKRLLS